MKIKFIFTACLPILFFTGLSCNSPTEPKDNPGLDTTSHNFVWRVDTLGTYLSTVRDVAIVDGNKIWAVGEFYKKHSTLDSTAKDVYGLCIWDGSKWNYKKVSYRFNGVEEPNSSAQLASIFILKSGVIWMTSNGRTPIRYKNGMFDSFLTTEITNDRVYFSKIWGLDDTHIWFVGNNGTILFFNGTTFTRIPYDESVDFIDVWGDESGVVRAVARKPNSFESAIVRINQISAAVEFSGLNQPVNSPKPDIFISVWWDQAENFFVGADNGFFKKNKTGFTRIFSPYDEGETKLVYAVRGVASNDVFIAGSNGQIVHYNGKTSVLYRNAVESYPFRRFETVQYSGNVVCAGGYMAGVNGWDDQLRGFVIIGKRF